MSSVDTSMKSNGASLSPILERHTPQHPLPEGIQNMETDQTVCQFCGVSYLIHHEIKRLEEQVAAQAEELKQCRASRDNEKKLKVELQKANNGLQSLQSMLSEKDAVVDRMTHKIESQKTKIEEISKENIRLKDVEASLRERLGMRAENFLQKSTILKKDLEVLRTELKDIKTSVEPMASNFSMYLKEVKERVQVMSSSISSETNDCKRRCQDLEEELVSKSKNEDLLQMTISTMQQEIKDLWDGKDKASGDLKSEIQHLQNEISTIQSQNTELMQDIGTLQTQVKMAKSDSAQMKETSMKKQQEVHSLTQKLHKTEQNAEMTIQRMNQEIRHLENDLIATNKEQQKWKSVEESFRKQQEALKMQMSTSTGETQLLHDSLEETKRELAALKNEREQMVMSHQNQIMQLRDSFREKLDNAQGNPMLMEKRLQELQEVHETEMEEKARQWKENFSIELGLEREKHCEEMRNSSAKYKEVIQQVESDLKRDMQQYISESQVFRLQIKSLKEEHSEKMSEQEQEKNGLKRLISTLEEKITQLTGEQEGASINSQAEVNELIKRLQDQEKEKTVLNEENASLKEEVSLLQETVRRECEERFELTEALSIIREQLKAAKANPPDSSVPPLPVSAINGPHRQDANQQRLLLSAKTLRTLESNVASRSMASLPDVLPKHATNNRSSYDSRNYNGQDITPHVKDLAFSNHTSKVASSNSQESVETVRRRIANVIKRK